MILNCEENDSMENVIPTPTCLAPNIVVSLFKLLTDELMTNIHCN